MIVASSANGSTLPSLVVHLERERARALGVSDDTAQKRVSRAVERLREFLAKRGVTINPNAPPATADKAAK